MSLLEVRGLTKNFGGLAAVSDLSMDINRGDISGLIGPNGAGKTTFLNLVSGVLHPTKGKVVFKGEDITGHRPDQVAAKGLVRTFQLTTLFGNFTVLQNMLMAYHLQVKSSPFHTLLNTRGTRHEEEEIRAKAGEVSRFVGLDGWESRLAKTLPHGHQRVLAVAIAICSAPELLLLDEPVSGMNIEETNHMVGLINKIKEAGTTILIIEHNMKVVMGLCNRITVLNFGMKIAEGTPDEIVKDKDVIDAYLGVEYAAQH